MPAEVVDAKTGVEEPLVVHGVNVPASHAEKLEGNRGQQERCPPLADRAR